jgi:eukaryotic-like serine/threonine-protein kinase
MDPRLLSNRYQIVRPIGTGDTTSVLAARDRLANRPVAIKVPIGQLANDKAFLLRLEREVAALAGFGHPNVAAVYAVERGGDAGFVVVELVDGASLGALLAGRGPLPPAQAAQLAATVCAALAAAHARGIVHGHLTAANVLLGVDGQVKLTDFRIAQAAQPMASAPDPGADLRALGRLLAAMLTGVVPADGEPVRLGPQVQVPAGLAAIVARTEDPERPYRSAVEVGRDVDHFLASVGPEAAQAQQPAMPLAPDATGVAVLAAPVPSRPAELVPSPAGSRRLRVAGGAAPAPPRRRRGLAVAAGLVGAGLLVGGAVTAVTRLDREPDGATGGVGQATAAPPSTVVRATTTSGPRPATSTSASAASTAASTVTSQASATTTPSAVTPQPTATTGQVLGPGQRIVADVVGLRPEQAAEVLAQAQLGMRSLLVLVRDPAQVQRVIAQQPTAGQVVPVGSEVTVLVGTLTSVRLWHYDGQLRLA